MASVVWNLVILFFHCTPDVHRFSRMPMKFNNLSETMLVFNIIFETRHKKSLYSCTTLVCACARACVRVLVHVCVCVCMYVCVYVLQRGVPPAPLILILNKARKKHNTITSETRSVAKPQI